jgi:hypothetical protein
LRRTTTTYRWAVAVALGTALFLVWGIGALGVLAYEGYRGDLMYLGVLAVAACGAVISRLRASGMARTMVATALAQVLVAVIALLAGAAGEPGTSVLEILGLNAMFAALFCLSAWLFRRAGQMVAEPV